MTSFFDPQQINFTFGQIALNLCLAFALAYLAGTAYRKLYTGPAYSFSFFVTLLVTPVVVSMIMMAIGSNVALSLGLVGALSIIRFRTVIKDTRDMSYLFLMIGIGLCCGSGAYLLAILGTLFVCAVVVGIHFAGKAGITPNEYILVFRQRGEDHSESRRVLNSLLTWRKLHGATDLGEGEGTEYTYRVRLGAQVGPETLLAKLSSITGLSYPSLISPESQLAI
ncbi:MAG: DUF4956 domain-containing protein [Phycisphaerales bacterium]|nr:MAG: DUF4956 domain-containing protein [Phycisphaerales bacterium]